MNMQHDTLPKSVGSLRVASGGSTVHGTCFLIGPTRALTCSHCLRAPGAAKAADRGTISFTQSGDPADVAFSVAFERFDRDACVDVAVLDLARPVAGTTSLRLANDEISAHPPWETFGHPKVVENAPVWLRGTVDGPYVPPGRGPGAALVSLQMEGDPTAAIEGMSGAPILTEQGVIGILSAQLYKETDGTGLTPAFAKAFASPTRLFSSLLPFLTAIASRSRVFIAYHRSPYETAFVQTLKNCLKVEGHDPFLDLDIDIGEDWALRIREKIQRADVFIPVLTRESIESPMLLQEIRIAYGRSRQTGLPILLPVRDPKLEALPFEFETYLGRLQYAPWSGSSGEADTQAAVDKLTAAVRTRILPVPPTTPDERPGTTSGIASPRRLRPSATALPIDDPFYVERPGDAEAFDRVDADSFALTVYSPPGFGKTSLALRLMDRCARDSRPTFMIDFRGFGRLPKDDEANPGLVLFLNDFAREICRVLKLSLPADPIANPPQIRALLDSAIERFPRLVLILDGLDRLIKRSYAEAFFLPLRSWIDQGIGCSFILCISTEPSNLVSDIMVSPFNIDKGPVLLGAFTRDDIAALAHRANVSLTPGQIDLLYMVTGGHPALTRQALAYVLAPGGGPSPVPTRDQILTRVTSIHDKCGTLDGPFSASLKALLSAIGSIRPLQADDPPLLAVMRSVIANAKLTPREASNADLLVTFGLLRFLGDDAPRRFAALNLAYARFFAAIP